jgi:hypothetical protein
VAPAAAEPSLLASRLLVALVADETGLGAPALAAVTVDGAQSALASVLAAPGSWHSCSPRPVPRRGFPVR